ncbi:MAG TPA: (2Fe-2S) ferredoxin domain-containing protein [Thermomicrobiales bacterium]|jgi:(2Fe-2S) ferredoxin|nr:(2Fe-2S) ferredoxin domain-containing protein [Thermomicrobiales bacterium]
MYWTERHILACTGNHCNQKGAANVINRLRFELMRRRMNDRIMMNTCGTIDLCDIGPNLVIYPDNIVYSNITEKDIPDIVKYLDGGPVVERLLTGPNSPAEKRREAFYAALQGQGNSLAEDAINALAAEHELDATWIAEQLRRGFMAKKPDADSGEDRYSMTSKALHRYRLG